MKIVSLIAITVILSGIVLSSSVYAEPNHDKFVPNRLLVKFNNNTSENQKHGLLEQNMAKVTDEISQIKVLIITVPDNAIDKVETALKNNPNVQYVERDWILESTAIPNDPEISKQWHLEKIGAYNSWDITHGNTAPIAILDTGVNSLQPDLAGKLQDGWNTYANNSDFSDGCGHGTQVAGAAAASTNNKVGGAGVAWDNPIIPIKVTDSNCYGYSSAIAKGITYSADKGAKVANISFGIFSGQVYSDAAKYMNSKGGLVVASAGNTGAYENVVDNPYIISVGATDGKDNITSFSSSGPYVDFTAPGIAIYTTCVCNTTESNSTGTYSYTTYYRYSSGTSFSSPIVAGAIALVFAANPLATPDQVFNALKASAVDLGTPGRDDYYGWGRINVNGAINIISANSQPIADTVSPTVSITSPTNSTTVSSAFTVTGDASDNVKLSKVELFVNGASSGQTSITPYSFSVDSSKLKGGNNVIDVKAYDASNNIAAAEVIINVGDIQPPTVSITSPISDSTIYGKTIISVLADDNYSVSKVEIFIDGSLQTTLTGKYDYSWNSRSVQSGTHIIMAKATDSNGNSAQTSISVITRK